MAISRQSIRVKLNKLALAWRVLRSDFAVVATIKDRTAYLAIGGQADMQDTMLAVIATKKNVTNLEQQIDLGVKVDGSQTALAALSAATEAWRQSL
jgi:hypothetical protein